MLELETPHLTLRLGTAVEPTPQALQAGFEQYKVAHEHPDCPFKAYRDTVLSIYFEGQLGRPYGFFDIYPKGADASVGHCNIHPRFCPPAERQLFYGMPEKPRHGSVEMEIGWATKAPHRRKGYASEAAARLVQYAFEQFELPLVVACTEKENTASMRVMQKIGMRLMEREDGIGVVGVAENPA